MPLLKEMNACSPSVRNSKGSSLLYTVGEMDLLPYLGEYSLKNMVLSTIFFFYWTTGSAFWNLVLKMNPVVSQPGYGTGGSMMNSDWQTGMFDCFDDLGICLCGAFCPLCLSCQIASDMNECCLCGASVAMRTLYRTRFGIPGSIFSDFLWLGCFPLCTLCQLKRDIEKRKAMNAF